MMRGTFKAHENGVISRLRASRRLSAATTEVFQIEPYKFANQLLGDWEATVEEYLADLQMGLESLNAAPQNDEQRQEIFALKKQIANTLVKKITIDRNRELHVEVSLNLIKLMKDQSDNSSTRGQIGQGEIYNHKR